MVVSKKYVHEGERVLLVDDFLADGKAMRAMIDLCEQAGAEVVGFVTAIEKAFQGGRQRIEEKGIKVYSGAIIKAFKDNKPVF